MRKLQHKIECPTLLLGLGNDLRGDDAIGLKVIDHVRAHIKDPKLVDIENTLASGINLLPYFSCYKKVIVVDAIEVTQDKIGKIWKVGIDQVKKLALPMRISHGMGLNDIVGICRKIGYDNPREVVLFLVGIGQLTNPYQIDLTEKLSAKIEKLIPLLSKKVIAEITAQ